MKQKKFFCAMASFFLAMLVATSLVSAVNVGVSPANAEFSNVLRGGYAERPVRVTIDTEREIGVVTSKWGDIADWINLSEENFTVSRENPYTLILSVQPPRDTPNGIYEGFVRIQSDRIAEPIPGHATGLIIPVLDVHVRVRVTDQEVIGCSASDFKISHAEEGDDVFFTALIQNTGNIWFSPLISLKILTQDASQIVKEVHHSDTQITPTQKEQVVVSFSSDDLEIGQYWVEAATVDCYAQQTLTFDVLEEGALRASGVLNQITVPTWSEEGDTIPIVVSFTNNGEKPVRSKFNGRVTRQNKIVQLMESDQEVFVDVGEDAQYQFYFTPKEPGRYLISGRVFYEGKRSYERSAAFNVQAKNSTLNTIIKTATYLLLIAIIAFLLARIRKERKSYNHRLRRIK